MPRNQESVANGCLPCASQVKLYSDPSSGTVFGSLSTMIGCDGGAEFFEIFFIIFPLTKHADNVRFADRGAFPVAGHAFHGDLVLAVQQDVGINGDVGFRGEALLKNI